MEQNLDIPNVPFIYLFFITDKKIKLRYFK